MSQQGIIFFLLSLGHQLVLLRDEMLHDKTDNIHRLGS